MNCWYFANMSILNKKNSNLNTISMASTKGYKSSTNSQLSMPQSVQNVIHLATCQLFLLKAWTNCIVTL